MVTTKNQHSKRNWIVYPTMFAIDVALIGFFIAEYYENSSIIFTASIIFLNIFVLPTLYQTIIKNKILLFWLFLNVILMGAWLYCLIVK